METYKSRPLADRMRPKILADFVGQAHIIGTGKVLRVAIESGNIPSMVLWGPPGSGKTTLARIIAATTKANFVHLSGATDGTADVKKTVETAKQDLRLGTKTILFIDEIHRFNKAQQDRLLPHVENGTIIFIGATTENPSFEVNSALLSRSRVFVLNKLESEDILKIIKRTKVKIDAKVAGYLAQMADGDARIALNALELAVSTKSKLTIENLSEALQRSHLLYDQGGEEHYNIISALHKSMRGGDADAALYWLGRMLEGGEDPLYVARRIIRFASEDIGLANSLALPQAVSAYQACHFIGMPECGVNLAQAVVYMPKSKKSVAIYDGYSAVQADIKRLPNEPVPLHLRNLPAGRQAPPPDLMKQQFYLPEKLTHKKYLK